MHKFLIATAVMLSLATPALARPVTRDQAVKTAVHEIGTGYSALKVDRVEYNQATGMFRVWMTSHTATPVSGYADIDRNTGKLTTTSFCGA